MSDKHSVQLKKGSKPVHKKRWRTVTAAVLAFVCVTSCILLPGCASPASEQHSGTSAIPGSGKTVLIGGEKVSAETIESVSDDCGISETELINTLERYASARDAVNEALSSGEVVSEADRADLESALERLKQERTIESWSFDDKSQYYLYQIVGGGFAAVPLKTDESVGWADKPSLQVPQSPWVEQCGTFLQNSNVSPGNRPRIHVLWSFNGDHPLYRFYGRTFWDALGAEVVFDDEVTLDDLRNLDQEDFDVTVFMCHGHNQGTIMPPNLLIETVPTIEEIARFFKQCRMQALQSPSENIQGLIPLPNGWLITPNFFTNTYSTEHPLQGAFMFYSCYFFGTSLKPKDTWPQTLLDLGAESVLGFRNSAWVYYGWHFIRTVVSQMLCGASVQEGFEIAKATWGDTGGDYLSGRDQDTIPCLAGDGSYRLSRTVDADPADELNAELRLQKELYWEFLTNTASITTDLCPGSLFLIDGYAMEDISGDGIPELLLSTTQEDGEGISGILVCDVAMDEKVWPVYYQEADPILSSVWLVNERWLRTDYYGGGSLYSSMNNLEIVLFAHTEPDEIGEGFGVRCFVDPGMDTQFDKWHQVGTMFQKEEPFHSTAISQAALNDYLRILPNTGAGEREIVFTPRSEFSPEENVGQDMSEIVKEIYLRFVDDHHFLQTDYYPHGVSFDISAYAMEDLSGDGVPELVLATSQETYFIAEITGILVCTIDDNQEVIPVFYMDTDVVFPIPSIVDERWIVFKYHGTGGDMETYYRTIIPEGVEEAKIEHIDGQTAYLTPLFSGTKEQFESFLLTVSGEAEPSERLIEFKYLD